MPNEVRDLDLSPLSPGCLMMMMYSASLRGLSSKISCWLRK
jgi:hypothetical protein